MDVLPLLLSFLSGAAACLSVLFRLSRQSALVQNATEEHSQLSSNSAASHQAKHHGPRGTKRLDGTQKLGLKQHSIEPADASRDSELKQQVTLAEANIKEVTASLEELRQVIAHQRDSDHERLQDQMEVLFSAWSEALKEEIQQKQEKVIQHAEGEMMAVDIKMQHLDELANKLSAGFKTLVTVNASIGSLQAAVQELQERDGSELHMHDLRKAESIPASPQHSSSLNNRILREESGSELYDSKIRAHTLGSPTGFKALKLTKKEPPKPVASAKGSFKINS